MTTRLIDKKTLHWATLLLILLLATFLRFHLLDTQSFWNDEGNSARLSERSIRLIIEGTASDIHPPLYYLILRGWRELVGDSEFGLRSFSAFAGVLTVAFSYGVGKELTQRGKGAKGQRKKKKILKFVGVVTAVFVTINPALIYYSQETRMYALMGLLAVMATWLLVVWWKRPSLPIAAAYVLTAAAGLYTQYFFPTVLVAHNVAVLVWLVQGARSRGQGARSGWRVAGGGWRVAGGGWRVAGGGWRVAGGGWRVAGGGWRVAGGGWRVAGGGWRVKSKQLPNYPISQSPNLPIPQPPNPLFHWSAMMISTFLLYAPWLPIFLVQFSSEPVKRPSLLPFLQDVWRWLLFGATGAETAVVWAATVAVLLLVVGVVNGRLRAILPLLMVITPIAFMFLTGTTGPEFFKFLVVSVPMLILLLALALTGNWMNLWGRGVVLVLLLGLMPGSRQSLSNLYHNPAYARADYRAMAARIEAEAHPNAGIVLEAANQWEVFTYYFEDDSIVYPFPKGRSLPKAEVIDSDLAEIAGKHNRLYAIFWGETQRDPERLVERWLDTHTFKAADEWIGDVRFVMYAVPAAAAGEMETAVFIPFGPSIQLNGFTLLENELQPGDIVQTTLFWQTSEQLDTRYKVFLHLLNEQGQLVAQRDSEPGGGLAMTTAWEPEQTVADNHGILLPHDLPEGVYQLVVGMYDIEDSEERLVVGGETAVSSTYSLGKISVGN